MQMTMIDLTDIPDAMVEDEVVVMGRQGSNCVTAYDLAGWAGTGEFEILVNISSRIPRYYLPLELQATVRTVENGRIEDGTLTTLT